MRVAAFNQTHFLFTFLNFIFVKKMKNQITSPTKELIDKYFKSPTWYQALNLIERANSIKFKNNSSEKFDINLAQRRKQKWRSQASFATDADFAERLAADNITEEEFLRLLTESDRSIQKRYHICPDWLKELEKTFSDFYARKPAAYYSEYQSVESLGFLTVIEPLIYQGCKNLHQKVQILAQTQANLPFNVATVEEILFANLPDRLLKLIGRTLVLELNVARMEGKLKGDTPEARFHSFIESLRQPEVALNLLQEYPVLARQAQIYIEQWVTYSIEFLQHLCADWKSICHSFNGDKDIGELTSIKGGEGDSHEGGRSVQIVEFSSGFRLVYKPRSMAVDLHFQELLSWLNNRGDHPPFRLLKILDCSTHGWSEFVDTFSCHSQTELQHFYQRQGGYLAVMYALEATDFHHENLIAAGEHPVLIDLETLFLPKLPKISLAGLEQPFDLDLFYSVMKTGLLPQRIWSDGKSDGIDMSGLVAQDGQLYPHDALDWDAIGTDEMKLTRRRIEMQGAKNRPSLKNKEVNVLDYIDEITAGFSKIYTLLAQNVDELLSDHSPLNQFAEDEIKVVLRPTRTYMLMLAESFHPNGLRDALYRDRTFDYLWVNTKIDSSYKRLIPFERRDLDQGDIPVFKTKSGSCHLWSSSKEQIPNFFEVSGLERVKHHLGRLNKENLAQQLWFIRASFATLMVNQNPVASRNETPSPLSNYPLNETPHQNHEQLLLKAKAIGDRLEALALHGNNAVTWFGLNLINKRYWEPMALDIDLYDGLAGITLFLAYLGKLSQESRYTELAQLTLNTIRCYLKYDHPFINSLGGFWGWGGNIYTLTHLGKLWNQTELIDEAESYVNLLPALIEQDEYFDILNGTAGCLISLLNLYHCRPTQPILSAAVQCGEHLLNQAQSMAKGTGWSSPNSKPLTGFSHGTAGISFALLKLADMTGEKRFRKVALEAIAYERSYFSASVGNWQDLREFESAILKGSQNQDKYMTSWCHGASGIGLARLRSLPYLDDAEIRAEINIALDTTLRDGFGSNHSLCHGDFGNLELLLQASEYLDDSQRRSQVNHLTAIILKDIEQHGWLCGVPMAVETPGLMTGLAGIGYGMLRMLEPTQVPSILVLD